jgi:hypothetical protein
MYTFVGPSEVISSKQKKTEMKLDINLLSKTNKYKTKQTNIPIDFVLPKLLNYLAFQSFDLELPDEGYSRNVHVH